MPARNIVFDRKIKSWEMSESKPTGERLAQTPPPRPAILREDLISCPFLES